MDVHYHSEDWCPFAAWLQLGSQCPQQRKTDNVRKSLNLVPVTRLLGSHSADNLDTRAGRGSSGADCILLESTAMASLPVGHVEALAGAHAEAFGVTV